jgi:hypothetical protein
MKKGLIALGIGLALFTAYKISRIPKLVITNVDSNNKTVSFQLVPMVGSAIVSGVFKFGSPAMGLQSGVYSVEQVDMQGTSPGIQVNVKQNGQMILQQNIYF